MKNRKKNLISQFRAEMTKAIVDNNNDIDCEAVRKVFDKYMDMEVDFLLSEDLEEAFDLVVESLGLGE